MPAPTRGPALLWTALLLFSPDGIFAAIISLDPPWSRIFRGENVTLTCGGNKSSEAGSTRWYHDGKLSAVTTSSLEIVNASSQDSGVYTCENSNSRQTESIRLEVFSDWLLLQTSPRVAKLGQPILIRCHSWKNWDAFKVVYYKNGEALKYWYENHNISIPHATFIDDGTYHCEGTVFRKHRISEPFVLTVMGPNAHYSLKFFIPLLVAILFIVDSGLFISTQKQFTFLLKSKKTRKGNKVLNLRPKPDPKEN
ncbi:high affinity immunoglobulin epsilon receptor subunit alpha [Tamandua tetradactyla]|uniref:high affinity immunoglobulin epsilon receptor subunit alpha n=1 Tax=Tamandua tetradactyla TaxID=48850 RepID=UPI00405495A2